eukprot:6460892-Amphidinium_carterae.1
MEIWLRFGDRGQRWLGVGDLDWVDVVLLSKLCLSIDRINLCPLIRLIWCWWMVWRVGVAVLCGCMRGVWWTVDVVVAAVDP